MLPVDIVTEDDCMHDGHGLASYSALYLTEPHVSSKAAAGIAKWVGGGGRVFASAGAGLLDETNQTNAAMASLYGVSQSAIYVGNGTDVDGVSKARSVTVQQGEQLLELRGQRHAGFYHTW